MNIFSNLLSTSWCNKWILSLQWEICIHMMCVHTCTCIVAPFILRQDFSFIVGYQAFWYTCTCILNTVDSLISVTCCAYLLIMCVLQKKNMKRIPSVKNKDVIHRQTSEAESECVCVELQCNWAWWQHNINQISFHSVWSPDSSSSQRTTQQTGTGKANNTCMYI